MVLRDLDLSNNRGVQKICLQNLGMITSRIRPKSCVGSVMSTGTNIEASVGAITAYLNPMQLPIGNLDIS